jgi:hypothetical protein
MQTNSKLYLWLRRHPLICFVLMTASFVAFGYLTVDLVRLLTTNASFVLTHGWQALKIGGLQQLLELWLGALLAMACFLFFKLCEQVLLQWLSQSNS